MNRLIPPYCALHSGSQSPVNQTPCLWTELHLLPPSTSFFAEHELSSLRVLWFNISYMLKREIMQLFHSRARIPIFIVPRFPSAAVLFLSTSLCEPLFWHHTWEGTAHFQTCPHAYSNCVYSRNAHEHKYTRYIQQQSRVLPLQVRGHGKHCYGVMEIGNVDTDANYIVDGSVASVIVWLDSQGTMMYSRFPDLSTLTIARLYIGFEA